MSTEVFVELTPEELRKKSEELRKKSEELRKKSEELAGKLVALDELEEERKEANKDFADRKKALSKEIRQLTACIRNKGEYQDRQSPMFTLKPEQKGRNRDA